MNNSIFYNGVFSRGFFTMAFLQLTFYDGVFLLWIFCNEVSKTHPQIIFTCEFDPNWTSANNYNMFCLIPNNFIYVLVHGFKMSYLGKYTTIYIKIYISLVLISEKGHLFKIENAQISFNSLFTVTIFKNLRLWFL